MSDSSRRARVGVRELRQNLSVYLRRVEAGETLDVTDHGRPVAQLSPRPPGGESAWDRLVADGRVRPAAGRLLERLPASLEAGPSLSEILAGMRDEDDR